MITWTRPLAVVCRTRAAAALSPHTLPSLYTNVKQTSVCLLAHVCLLLGAAADTHTYT